MCFKKSFYGSVKLRKQRSRRCVDHGNTTDISIANLQFWGFREFTRENPYTAACKFSEAKSHSQRAGTVVWVWQLQC